MDSPSYYHPVNPSMNRRCHGHDYHSRCIYMVTIKAATGRQPFGRVEGTDDAPRFVHSDLGREVERAWWRGAEVYDGVRLLDFQLMPDHLHGIVFFTRQLPFDLGRVVNGFKKVTTYAFAHRPGATAGATLWQPGYHDRILRREGQLDVLKRYIADNPRRRLLRQLHRDLFTVVHHLQVAGMDMDAQGNRFLLDSPQLVAVRCSRNANAVAERDRFLAMAARGAVLVSPSVSEGEQLAMNSAMKAGFPVIFVRRSGFSDFAKPGGELFDRCAAGQLLQLSPWPYTTRQEPLTRKKCLAMNDVAADICAGHDLLL